MHPHQRLALECAWEAFERGGIDPSSVRGSDTGVFLGVTSIPYETLGEGVDGDSPLMVAGHMTSMAAGRISYLFGLEDQPWRWIPLARRRWLRFIKPSDH